MLRVKPVSDAVHFIEDCIMDTSLDIVYVIAVDPDPGGQKLTTNIEKVNKVHFMKCGCSL
jgi:pentose-5-phosphate-3-epimerase